MLKEPYHIILRVRRICTIVSQEEIKIKRLNELKSNLLKCNYPLLLINLTCLAIKKIVYMYYNVTDAKTFILARLIIFDKD